MQECDLCHTISGGWIVTIPYSGFPVGKLPTARNLRAAKLGELTAFVCDRCSQEAMKGTHFAGYGMLIGWPIVLTFAFGVRVEYSLLLGAGIAVLVYVNVRFRMPNNPLGAQSCALRIFAKMKDDLARQHNLPAWDLNAIQADLDIKKSRAL